MPQYTYRCRKCGKKFNNHAPIDREPIKNCPLFEKDGETIVGECNGEVYRVIGDIAFTIK